jgi:hypothetical protein
MHPFCGSYLTVIFKAGLFSASVTAFIIESYKTLTPSPEDTTVAVLMRISEQLATISNTSASVPLAPLSPGFSPPTSALVCNILWFLSLGFSLACAVSATLVEQWVRHYIIDTESGLALHERARVSAYLFEGLEKFNMAGVVKAIPMLLHISLLLFFAGLVEFLRPINPVLCALTILMLVLSGSLYALATFMPIFRLDCPYRTPLSGLVWKVLIALRLLRRRDMYGNTVLISKSMPQAREVDATEISRERDQRDLNAMSWTLATLRQDKEFKAFVEVIPKVVTSFDYSAKLLLGKLLHHENVSIKLSYRVPRLLVSCTGGTIEKSVAQKRATTCLTAMWSLNMMTIHTNSYNPSTTIPFTPEKETFHGFTLQDIRTVRNELPMVEKYAVSASAVIVRSLLDAYVGFTVEMDHNLSQFIQTGETRHAHLSRNSGYQQGKPSRILNTIQRTMDALSEHLDRFREMDSALPFLLCGTLRTELTKAYRFVTDTSIDRDGLDFAGNALDAVHTFHELLNQAGFNLAVDYAKALIADQSPPYEAFNTMRRVFLKIEFDHPVSTESQFRLVNYLDDALESNREGKTRIPQSIINIILGLTRVIDDPTCALKARRVVDRCMRYFTGTEEAEKALSRLDEILDAPMPALDLFTSHIYSNVRPDPQPRKMEVDDPYAVATLAGVSMPP